MSRLRLMNIFGSSTGSIIEPTTDGRVNVTVQDSTGGALFQSTNPGIVQNSSTPKISIVSSSSAELFKNNNPGKVDFHLPNVDAFGKLRISQSKTLLDSQVQYDSGTLYTWNESNSGGGSITHDPLTSTIAMALSTANGDKIIRQTKRYVRYQPGKSQFVAISAVMGAAKANVRQRIGQFDDDNGLFFEQDENNLKVMRRTNATGTPTDNVVNQSSWNLDTLDGNGDSGITLDTSKANIFVIYYQWLGVGRVIMGLDVNGELVPVHEFDNANSLLTTYMGTANLPVRYEIENTAEAASATTMTQICCAVASESGFTEDRGVSHHVGTGTTAINVGTIRPIVTIKPKLNYRTTSLDNRSETLLEDFSVLAVTDNVHWQLIYNGSINSTGSYADPSTYANFEYDVTSTGVSGGEVILGGFIGSGRSLSIPLAEVLKNKLVLTNNITNTSGDTLTLACAGAGSTTPTVYVGLNVKESY